MSASEKNRIELLRAFARSFEDYELGEPVPVSEQVTVDSEIRISCDVEESRQDEKPEGVASYIIFKPRALRVALHDAQRQAVKDPVAVVRELAPEWLKHPPVEGKRMSSSDILGYRAVTEKVLDRVELVTCRNCRGKGSVIRERTEYQPIYCPRCGGTGSYTETVYVNSPGTTAHGMQQTVTRLCSSCAGKSPTRTIRESVSCGTCAGSGSVQKEFFRKKTVYETCRVRTTLVVEGKERLSKTLARLRKRAPAPETSLSGLLRLSPSPEVRIKEKRSKLRLAVKSEVPLYTYEVRRNGKSVGTVYAAPEDGSALCVASSTFFDAGMKRKIRQIRGLSREAFEQLRDSDIVVDALAISVEAKRPRLRERAVAWSLSPDVFEKACKAGSKCMSRGEGLFSWLGKHLGQGGKN